MRLRRRGAVSKTVRIPKSLVPVVGKEIVRLTIHPELYERSKRDVRWNQVSEGRLPPSEIVLYARRSYPDLSLSAAVEAVLIDLLENRVHNNESDRFALLAPLDKIRLTQKRNRMARYLKSLIG